MSYAYDDVGNVLSISSNAVEVYSQNFQYDDLDRLTQAAESPAGFRLSYKYDAVGNLLEVNSSGTVSTYTYGTGNSPGPHAVVSISGGGPTVDCSGNLPPAVGDWIISSPTLCRLSSIILSLGSKLKVSGGQSVTLQDSTLNLDGDIQLDGNLILDGPSAGIDFGGNSASGVGTSGASPAGTQTLTYDNSGSLTSGFGQTYEYDDANRLKTVRKAGASVESYTYDHNGQRFKKIAGSQNAFMQAMIKDGELLLYDGSVIYSTSGYNKLLEVGHDKEMSYQPKANIGLLFSKDRNVPVHFRLFFGSVHEIKTIDRIAHEMRDRNMMFIADKGFYKNGLFADLEELKIGFLIPLPRDDKRIDYSRECGGYFKYHKRIIRHTSWKEGEYWIIHFEDLYLKAAETNEYYSLMLEKKAKKIKKKIVFHEEWAGKISLLSNRRLTPKEAYLLWKSRDRIEKAFNILQNHLSTDKPYVSNEDVFRGYLFASFISLIVYYLILNLLKKRGLNDRVSVDDVMLEFSKVVVEDGPCPTFAEIPAKVEKLAKDLGVWDILTKI